MAELKFTILGDTSKLKRQLQDTFKERFGGGGGAAGGAGNKSQSLLGTIATRLLPLGVLLSLKPVADLLGILANFAVIGALQLFKLWKIFQSIKSNLAGWIWEKLKTGFEFVRDIIKDKVQRVKEGLLQLKDKLVSKLISLKNSFLELITGLPGRIKEKLIALWDILTTKFNEVKETIASWIGSLIERAKLIWDMIKEVGKIIREKLISTVKTVWNKIVELKNRIVERFEDLKQKVIELIKELPERIWALVKQLGSIIANAVSSAVKKLNPFRKKSSDKRVNDAILRPDGSVIETHPNDTIIATQNPGAVGGGGNTFIFQGVTIPEMMEIVKKELSLDSQTHTRF